MTRRSPLLEWLPPLLVGVSAAVVAEVALSVLLYGGPGFVRSLTTILAVEGLAFAGGLWNSPTVGPDLVDRLRRRWLLCLFSFVGAAGFGMAWSLVPAVGEGALGQGLGLAFLAAIPLYASGAVLGGMSVLASSDVGERLSAPGAAAAAGAALGFVLTGLALPRVPLPASLILACLVLLSLGGMIYGGVLAARTDVRVLGSRSGRGTDVSVQERRLPAAGLAVRELREGSTVRRWTPLDDDGPVPWDVAVLQAVLPRYEGPPSSRVLLVGGGVSAVPRTFVERHPAGSVEILERAASVVELGRQHFGTDLSVGRNGRVSVSVGNLDDGIARRDGSYDLVVVDSTALEPMGGVVGLSHMARRRLPALLAPGGTLAWGPGGVGSPAGIELEVQTAPGWSVRRYRRPSQGAEELETVVLFHRDDGERWSPALPGFKEVPVS